VSKIEHEQVTENLQETWQELLGAHILTSNHHHLIDA